MFVLEASLWLNSLPQKKRRKQNDEAEEDEGMVTQTAVFTSKSDRAALFSETSVDLEANRASQPQFKSVSYSPGRPLPPKLLETPVNHRPQVIRISKPNLHLHPPPNNLHPSLFYRWTPFARLFVCLLRRRFCFVEDATTANETGLNV